MLKRTRSAKGFTLIELMLVVIIIGALTAMVMPRLAGRATAEIVAAMREFRSGHRPGTVMDRIAKGFSEAETAAIADWYAGQKP